MTLGGLLAFWQQSVHRSQLLSDTVIGERRLDGLAARSWPVGRAPSMRWVLVDLIEEYARHNGSPDLLREAIDGNTGE